MPKNVLVLGAGLISPPLLRHLLERTDHRIVVAALDVARALPVIEGFHRARALRLDVGDPRALEPLVREADLVVSLLPAERNPAVAALAVGHRVPMVNTSYLAPAMRELDGAARDAGVLLLSEIGLDPGLDHMSALEMLRGIESRGGTVETFSSSVGGLPDPVANTNPWGYKFSWYPRAVMLAARNPARFLRRGEVVNIDGEALFDHRWPCPVEGIGVMEVYANRDALAYRDAYGLSGAQGVFRGTIRYPGWSETLRAVGALGLLEIEERDWPEGTTYADVTTRLLAPDPSPPVVRVARFLEIDPDSKLLARFEWAGLLSLRSVPARRAAPLDVLVGRLERLMQYAPGERDMVVMKHEVDAGFPDGHRERVTATLVALGEPFGETALSRTASLPAAVAARLILDGTILSAGVQIPVVPEIAQPVLAELKELGLGLTERSTSRYPGPLE